MHSGHSHNQRQTTINCIHWPCTKYYKTKCPLILKTKKETVIETKSSHNHNRYPGECKGKEIVNQVKRRVQYSTPTVAIAKELSEISDEYEVQQAMPKKDNLLRAVSRKQQKEICFHLEKWSKPMTDQMTGNQNPFKLVVLVIFKLHLIFFLVKFWNIILKFYTYGSLSNKTSGNYGQTVLLTTFNWFFNYFNCFRTSWKNWITLSLNN